MATLTNYKIFRQLTFHTEKGIGGVDGDGARGLVQWSGT